MARRSIVIEFEQNRLCWAVAGQGEGGVQLQAAGALARPEERPAPEFLREALEGVVQPGEGVTLLLPPGGYWVRRLSYPFAEPRKIAAALPLDLASRLPVAGEGLTMAGDRPRTRQGTTTLLAVAVPDPEIGQRLALAEEAGLHVERCDLVPFALARTGEAPRLIAWVSATALVVGLAAEGQLLDQVTSRLAPGEERIASLDRLATALERTHGFRELPLQVVGPMADTVLQEDGLPEPGRRREPLPALASGTELAPELAPVALAALGLARAPRMAALNLRRGRFAQRSAWQPLRRLLGVTAALMTLLLLCGMLAVWLDLRARAQEAQRLQTLAEVRFRQLFPEVGALVDLPMQAEAQLRDLRRRAGGAGGAGASGLVLLREVSARIPAEVRLIVGEWLFAPGEVRISGEADSFEAVNRVTQLLQASPRIREAQVSEARAEASGRVSFRLRLVAEDAGGTP